MNKNRLRIQKQNLAQLIYSGTNISFKKLNQIIERHLSCLYVKGSVIICTKNYYMIISKRIIYYFDLNRGFIRIPINIYNKKILEELEPEILSIKIIDNPFNKNSLSISSYYNTDKAKNKFKKFIKAKYTKLQEEKNNALPKLDTIIGDTFKVITYERKELAAKSRFLNDFYNINFAVSIYVRAISYKILLGDHITTNYETDESIETKGWFMEISYNKIRLGRYILDKASAECNYIHSHMNGNINTIGEAISYCTNGRGFLEIPKADILTYINNKSYRNVKNDFEFGIYLLNFCYQIIEYIKQESISGIPYRRIASVKKYILQRFFNSKDLYNFFTFSDLGNSLNYDKFIPYLFTIYNTSQLVDKGILHYDLFSKSYELTKDYKKNLLKDKQILNYLVNNNNLFIKIVVSHSSTIGSERIVSNEEERAAIREDYRMISIADYVKMITLLKKESTFKIKATKNVRKVIGYSENEIYVTNIEDTVASPKDLLKTDLSLDKLQLNVDPVTLTLSINKKIKEYEENPNTATAGEKITIN